MDMKVRPLYEQRVIFGKNIEPEVDKYLQEAAAQAHNFPMAEKALLKAREMAPEQLEVFIALYKLYFYRGFTDKAEDVVLQTLETAAKSGGFDPDWNKLPIGTDEWRRSEGPYRTYLYSLKALCFIRLRQNNQVSAGELLTTLEHLDPDDQVGASVLRDLAEGID